MLKILCAAMLAVNIFMLLSFCLVLGPATPIASIICFILGIILSVIGLAVSIEFEYGKSKGSDDDR
jgi:uncharacterized membrane protein YczE